MRIVFHNPHVDTHFSTPVFNYLTNRFSHKKYEYLFRYFYEQGNLAIFVDGFDSSLNSFFKKFISNRFEFYIWLLINRLNPLRIQIINDPTQLSRADVMFSFAFRNLDREGPALDLLKNLNCKKVFHLTHYMLDTSTIARNFDFVHGDLIVAENNLSKNSAYFNNFFTAYNTNVYLLPFVPSKRFVKNVCFSNRVNKCLATGTFETISPSNRTSDFQAYFKVDTFHPLRKEIFQKKQQLSSSISSFIGDYNEKKAKPIRPDKSKIQRALTLIYKTYFVKQSAYFKFDIVKTYNTYRMFVVPEELNDLPGIGFVEGMACGCAYIGKKSPIYSDLGLVAGKHFVEYDGTLDDLVDKITYYQKSYSKLELIADEGSKYIHEKLNRDFVAKMFYRTMAELG